MMFSLQRQDLSDAVAGSETTMSEKDPNGVLHKWRIKASKTIFALKTTIEEGMLEHIRNDKTPKEAWDTFMLLFSKKNDTRLQLIENEMLSISQRNMWWLLNTFIGSSQFVGRLLNYIQNLLLEKLEWTWLLSMDCDQNIEALLLLYKDDLLKHHSYILKIC